eukprot:scaffold17088_cov17-Tisochrysis_lutea.AAC.4
MVYLSDRALEGLKEYKYKPGGELQGTLATCGAQGALKQRRVCRKHFVSIPQYTASPRGMFSLILSDRLCAFQLVF